jgi:hypothetical protein
VGAQANNIDIDLVKLVFTVSASSPPASTHTANDAFMMINLWLCLSGLLLLAVT